MCSGCPSRRLGRAPGKRCTIRVSVDVSSMFHISCRRLVGASTASSRRLVDVPPKCAPPNPTVPTWEIDSCELRWPYGQLQSTVLKSALGPDLGSRPPGALLDTVRNSRGSPPDRIRSLDAPCDGVFSPVAPVSRFISSGRYRSLSATSSRRIVLGQRLVDSELQ